MYCIGVLFHLKTAGVFIGRNVAKFLTQKAIFFTVIQLTVLVFRLKELKTFNSNFYKKKYIRPFLTKIFNKIILCAIVVTLYKQIKH